MLNRIFIAAIAIAFVAVGFLEFYGYTWLASIGDPRAAYEGFRYYQSAGWAALWLSAAVLLAIANVILWSSRRAWAMWAAFGYFAFFIVIRFFATGRAGASFYRTIDPSAPGVDLSPFLGVALVALAAAIVYFDQYLVLRLLDRMYPPAEAEPAIDGETEN